MHHGAAWWCCGDDANSLHRWEKRRRLRSAHQLSSTLRYTRLQQRRARVRRRCVACVAVDTGAHGTALRHSAAAEHAAAVGEGGSTWRLLTCAPCSASARVRSPRHKVSARCRRGVGEVLNAASRSTIPGRAASASRRAVAGLTSTAVTRPSGTPRCAPRTHVRRCKRMWPNARACACVRAAWALSTRRAHPGARAARAM